MPIIGIISQPAAGSINAAYNEILLRVTATKTDGTLVPPLVFCDIYFFGIFYKTIAKSQYSKLNPTNSEWEFDIQDVVQEYLRKQIAPNGEAAMIEAPVIVARTSCTFRSSGTDADGFLVSENIAPIQGTSSSNPVSGTGTPSNVFYGVNAALQRDDNPSLATHLNTFRNRVWVPNTYPLTHRPDYYKICKDDSDSFPILSSRKPTTLTLHYMVRGTNVWSTIDYVIPCVGVGYVGFNLPNAQSGVVYNYSLQLTGSKPFSITGVVVKPAWMTINVVDDKLVFSGMPVDADIGAGINVSGELENCAGVLPLAFADTLNVVAATACIPVDTGNYIVPDALANAPYVYDLPLVGTAPFQLFPNPVLPSWMTIAINGSNVEFRGTPSTGDVGNDKAIKFRVMNCVSGTPQQDQVVDLIDVVATGRRVVVLNETANDIQLTNTNGTITIVAGNHAEFNMISGLFTVTTMIDPDRTISVADGLPIALHTIIDYLDVNQGDVINIPPTEFNITRFIVIE